MSSDPNSPRSKALRYISNARFHRCFTLPATADHGTLTVSYADIGRVPEPPGTNPNLPTILFMPGMFASRYLGISMHAIAEKLGVRVLVVDRPGMGNSTDIPLQQRVPIWIELVPRLLAHLGIEHVALASHSAGTIYLLNTLYHCRGILCPERPFVAFLAPWVDPSHSRVTSMQMAQYVPVKAFSAWHLIPRFFVLNAGPAFASSGAVVTKFSNVVSPGGIGGGQDSSEQEKNRRRIEKDYGLSRDVQVELDTLVSRFIFEENTVGANSEALLCLRKGPSGTWGKCEDYGAFVRELVDLERRGGGAGGSTEGRVRLKVRACFAESDAMIGKRGQRYVEECWRGKEDGEFQDLVDFETRTAAGVDHDSLVQSVEALERIFVDAGGIVDHGAD